MAKVDFMGEESNSDLKFFSEVDMVNGKISSEYPAWYYDTAVDDLKDDIRREQYNIDSGIVPDKSRPEVLSRIKRLNEKLDDIEKSVPKLDENSENKLRKVQKSLAKDIAERMFTRSQMQKGLADGHQEARRMTEPSITVTPEVAEVAKACNVRIIDGKITRTGAEKMYKIASRYFGDLSNTESLRRD